MRFSLMMAVILGSTALAASAGAQQIQRSEPPPGQLKPGETVFVDDGRCPQGQVREVTGAPRQTTRDSLASATTAPTRIRRCVARPR